MLLHHCCPAWWGAPSPSPEVSDFLVFEPATISRKPRFPHFLGTTISRGEYCLSVALSVVPVSGFSQLLRAFWWWTIALLPWRHTFIPPRWIMSPSWRIAPSSWRDLAFFSCRLSSFARCPQKSWWGLRPHSLWRSQVGSSFVGWESRPLGAILFCSMCLVRFCILMQTPLDLFWWWFECFIWNHSSNHLLFHFF